MIDVESTLTELLPEEVEIDGTREKNNKLFFFTAIFLKVITTDIFNVLIMQIRKWRHQGG